VLKEKAGLGEEWGDNRESDPPFSKFHRRTAPLTENGQGHHRSRGKGPLFSGDGLWWKSQGPPKKVVRWQQREILAFKGVQAFFFNIEGKVNMTLEGGGGGGKRTQGKRISPSWKNCINN